ncbi:hypothetical protein A4X06_0g8734, partial [Tilletia controversa]
TLCSLPRTAQAYVRDVVSAFRQIPTAASQWPSTVVEWEGRFYIDTFLAFGLGPACGAFGLFADAFADIVRRKGIAVTSHWVDDNIFLRVPVPALDQVNAARAAKRRRMATTPTAQRGRLSWLDADGNQHDDDYTGPLRVQPGAEDGYNCGISDIVAVSDALGWPWEPRKDAPWSHIFDFTGIRFNIVTREVALPEKKRLKYLRSIAEWKARGSRHQLSEAQSLHGKLEHARLVFIDGKWHLKGLIDFIASAEREPERRYQLRHSGSRIGADLDWWERQLRLDNHWRCFDPPPPSDVSCFCDGSTSYGAGLHIAGVERSFPLRAEFVGNVDIKVVEALALELAVRTVVLLGHNNKAIIIHSDSTAVIGAYENGEMDSAQPNAVLERVAALEHAHSLRVHLRYINTKDNPADVPSRGAANSNPRRLPLPDLPDCVSCWFGPSW